MTVAFGPVVDEPFAGAVIVTTGGVGTDGEYVNDRQATLLF